VIVTFVAVSPERQALSKVTP